jgi:hypothetical protein
MDETALPEPDVDGEYYNGEGTIKVDIIVEPKSKN